MSVKISAMTAIGVLAAEDLFEVVDDPSGTPLTRKATGTQVSAMVGTTLGLGAGSANEIGYSDGSGGLSFSPFLSYNGSTLNVNTALTVFDGVDYVRLTSASGESYIQVGASAIDTTAVLNISRYFTAGDDIAEFNVNAVASTISGTLDVTGDIATPSNISTTGGYIWLNRLGDATEAYLTVASDDGNDSYLTFMGTGEQVIWRWTREATTEDLLLQRYVSGGPQDAPISIANSTGDVTIANGLQVESVNVGDALGATVINSNANDLVIKATTGSPGMTLHSSDYSNCNIYFSDPLSATAGYINYSHGSDTMTFGASGGNQLEITATTADFQDNTIQTSGSIQSTGGSYIRHFKTSGNANVNASSVSGSYSLFGAQTGGTARWEIGKSNTAESGSDAGSNFVIRRYNDSAVFQDTALEINRATGDVTIANELTVTGDVTLGEVATAQIETSAAGGIVKVYNSGFETLFINSAAVRPGRDNQVTSGGSSTRWSNVYSYAGDFSGDITTTGDLAIGSSATVVPSTAADDIVIDKGAATSGISVISTSAGYLMFGDAADADVGQIAYGHGSNNFAFTANGGTQFDIRDGTINAQDNDITTTGEITSGNIFINEGASASADVAGDGQLWVKSDTPNRIMFTDDAGTDINLQTGYELLATGSLSGSTAIDITGYTDFRILKLVVVGATVTGDGNNLEIDFSFDGGSTYASDSWDKSYHSVAMGDTTALIGTDAASGTMYFTGPIGNLSSEYANATMEFFGATQAVQTWATGECMNINASGVKYFQRLYGIELTTDVVDYIRITESTLDGGTYHLYGVRN